MDADADQWHFWPDGQGTYDAWSVTRLERLVAGSRTVEVPVDSVEELDTPYWSMEPMTVRQVVEHAMLLRTVDTSRPVIVGPDGRLMDGMHRVAVALVEGRATLPGVRLTELPEPDLRHVGISADGQPVSPAPR